MRWLVLALAGCSFQAGAVPGDGVQKRLDAPGDGVAADGGMDGPSDASPLTPIVFIQSGTNMGSVDATSISVTYSKPQAAGDFNVAVLSLGLKAATSATISDTSLNTYASLPGTSVNGIAQKIFYAPDINSANADANMVTVTLSTQINSVTLRIVEYSGIAQTNPLDVDSTAVGLGMAADSGSVTTTHAHDLIYGADTSDGNASAGAGFTQRILFAGDVVEDQIATVVATYDATMALDVPTDWIATVAAFKAAD